MSKSTFICHRCRQALAIKHHGGRLKIEPAVLVVLLPPDQAELTCPCGAKRVVDLPRLLPKAA